jgi:hypothetical protein
MRPLLGSKRTLIWLEIFESVQRLDLRMVHFSCHWAPFVTLLSKRCVVSALSYLCFLKNDTVLIKLLQILGLLLRFNI